MSDKFKSRANCVGMWAFVTGTTTALALDRLVRAELFWMSGYVVLAAFGAVAWATIARMSDEEFSQL